MLVGLSSAAIALTTAESACMARCAAEERDGMRTHPEIACVDECVWRGGAEACVWPGCSTRSTLFSPLVLAAAGAGLLLVFFLVRR
jgi:hypothetical protein